MATTIIVESSGKSGQRTGDWIVKKGTGRGATNIDRFQVKKAAVKRARQAARGVARRGGEAVLKVQNTDGTIATTASYGG